MKQNVLIVGSGAREHALAWKIAQSPDIGDLHLAPGNDGMRNLGKCVAIDPKDETAIAQLADYARDNRIHLTIVGPEIPLTLGIVDFFRARELRIFGPAKTATEIEASKAFSKQLMTDAGIRTAQFRSYAAEEYDDAVRHLRYRAMPVVLKASGPAAGKGVVICHEREEALRCLESMVIGQKFGAAGDIVVIEDFLEGPELSVHALSDGKTAYLLPFSRDYKRIFEGDGGENTGGMGAIAPVASISAEIRDGITQGIVHAALGGLQRYDRTFTGCLYPGIMLTADGPAVLEFNARFGDPETQVYMRLLDSDLLTLFNACVDGTLDQQTPRWSQEHAICITLASGGYPEKSSAPVPITGLDEARNLPGIVIFCAGVQDRNGVLHTNGGRILSITATGATAEEARIRAIAAADRIKFEGKQFRRDIGL